MTVAREVILDLLPVYFAGEASPATRELVEAHLKDDPELAQKLRLQWAENFRTIAPSTLPPELELKSLRRTRGLLGWQKWCFGLALAFTAIGMSIRFTFQPGRPADVHMMLFEYPGPFAVSLALGIAFWIAHALLRHRLKGGGL